MTYKGMFLSALLVPVAVTSYGKTDVEQKIQQLREKRYQKELELSELGAKISEKQDLLASMWSKTNDFVLEMAEKKKLSEQEVEAFLKEINDSADSFETYIEHVLAAREDVKQKFVKTLLKTENRSLEDFEAAKFYVIRNILEHNLLKVLLESFEASLQEMIEIDRELDVLQNQNLHN